MSWVFEQSTGHLTHFYEDGSTPTCYMGGWSGCGEGLNCAEKENVANVGPIPRGVYRIGDPFSSATHGPFCLRLTPDPANAMHNRSGFLIHGQSKEDPDNSSQGCIIQPRAVRELIHESIIKDSRDRMLKVVA